MAIRLAAFLERKLLERINTYGYRYSVRQYADDIGLEHDTLLAMMNKPEAKAITFATLQTLISFFGKEFTDEFELTAPEVPRGRLEPAEPEGG